MTRPHIGLDDTKLIKVTRQMRRQMARGGCPALVWLLTGAVLLSIAARSGGAVQSAPPHAEDACVRQRDDALAAAGGATGAETRSLVRRIGKRVCALPVPPTQGGAGAARWGSEAAREPAGSVPLARGAQRRSAAGDAELRVEHSGAELRHPERPRVPPGRGIARGPSAPPGEPASTCASKVFPWVARQRAGRCKRGSRRGA